MMSAVDREIVGRVMAGPEHSSFSAAEFVLIVTWVNAREAACTEGVSCPVGITNQIKANA